MSDADRKCYNCENFREGLFCGYVSSNCEIYGSLDVDQHERHPDTEAARCKEYTLKQPKKPETADDRVQRMIRALWPNGYNPRR